MIPWHLAPRMKDDVRREPQRLEISSFYAETISVYQNTLVSMKGCDYRERPDPQEDEYVPNLADLWEDSENWVRKLRIDCSYAEFRVITKKLWLFQSDRVKRSEFKEKRIMPSEPRIWSTPWSSPIPLYQLTAKMKLVRLDPATLSIAVSTLDQLRQPYYHVVTRTDFLLNWSFKLSLCYFNATEAPILGIFLEQDSPQGGFDLSTIRMKSP